MVSGHYANIEQGTPLRSLLPADQFRTVSQETRDTVPLTPNEVAVTVVMKPAFVKRLHFPVPWDGILYGVGGARGSGSRKKKKNKRKKDNKRGEKDEVKEREE